MKTFAAFLLENQGYRFRYHDTLNPKLWHNDKLRSKVREKLLKIANKYFAYLEVSPEYHIIDIIITGSNVNYNYTPFSDLDLHIIIDKNKDYADPVGLDLEDVLDTKKKYWSVIHNITIFGIPVEVYVQLQDQKLTATGVYSILTNQWDIKPTYLENLPNNVNVYAINIKSKALMKQIDAAISNKDYSHIKKLKERLKDMRHSGLRKSGEFSVENLTYKNLRDQGYLKKLRQVRLEISDRTLSLK